MRPHRATQQAQDAQAEALAAFAGASEAPPPAEAAVVEPPERSDPAAAYPAPEPPPVPDRPRAGRETAAIRAARTTIPLCLVLAVVLFLIGIGRFVLPLDSPLRLMPAGMAVGSLLLGLLLGLATWVLMRQVTRHVRGRGPGEH